jgi:hypothetical protein
MSSFGAYNFELVPNFWKMCAPVIYIKTVIFQDIVSEQDVFSVHAVEE